MKSTTLRKLCLSLLLLVCVSTIHPRTASANCTGCLGSTSHTVTCWSYGSTCAAALASLAANCEATATEEGNCGLPGAYACNFAATSQSACYWNGSQYQIDATGTHGCQRCGQ
jgi:hypothetical protein